MNLDGPRVFLLISEQESSASLRQSTASWPVATESPGSLDAFLKLFHAGLSGCVVTPAPATRLLGVLAGVELALPAVVLTPIGDVDSAVGAMRRGAFTAVERSPDGHRLRAAVESALEFDRRQQKWRHWKQERRRRLERLSESERQVLKLVLEGLPNKAIAARLGVSVRTIEGRRQSLYRKTESPGIAELIRLVFEAQQPICHRHLRDGQRNESTATDEPTWRFSSATVPSLGRAAPPHAESMLR